MPSFLSHLQNLLEERKSEQLLESVVAGIKEVNATNKDKITESEIEELMETLSNDEELLVEFLGQLAGAIGKKLSGFGGALNTYSANQSKKALRKDRKNKLKKARTDSRAGHSAAIKTYMKTLKGGDPRERNKAYSAMKLAQQKSLASRGITLKSPDKAYLNQKGQRVLPNSIHKEYKRKFGIKDWTELIKLAQENLNEQRVK